MNNLPIDLYFDCLLGENGTNITINNTINTTAIIKDTAERSYWFDKSIYVPSSVSLDTGWWIYIYYNKPNTK